MSANVFVYGTLLVPEMMQTVAGREFAFASATAHGYVRYYLKGRVYPGIATNPDSHVDGLVYLNVDADALARLDYFEGPEYKRQQIQVVTPNRGILAAEAYVVPDEKRHLLSNRPWQLDEFLNQGLNGFLCHARDAMRNYTPGTQVHR